MTPTPPPRASTPSRRRPKRHMRLSAVPWETYRQLLKAFEHKPGVRLAYDRGELEIMSPSFEHEKDGALLAQMVYILAEERGLPFCPGGSVTLKLRKALKGIEPDQCFWIANAAQVEKLPKLDLRIHPPPDLAIEVDVWNSSLNRFRIYARLRIPELWRLDGNDLRFHQLCGKKYMEIAESAAFPGLVAGELLPFIIRARESSPFISVMQAFRAWVKEHIANPSPPPQ